MSNGNEITNKDIDLWWEKKYEKMQCCQLVVRTIEIVAPIILSPAHAFKTSYWFLSASSSSSSISFSLSSSYCYYFFFSYIISNPIPFRLVASPSSCKLKLSLPPLMFLRRYSTPCSSQTSPISCRRWGTRGRCFLQLVLYNIQCKKGEKALAAVVNNWWVDCHVETECLCNNIRSLFLLHSFACFWLQRRFPSRQKLTTDFYTSLPNIDVYFDGTLVTTKLVLEIWHQDYPINFGVICNTCYPCYRQQKNTTFTNWKKGHNSHKNFDGKSGAT